MCDLFFSSLFSVYVAREFDVNELNWTGEDRFEIYQRNLAKERKMKESNSTWTCTCDSKFDWIWSILIIDSFSFHVYESHGWTVCIKNDSMKIIYNKYISITFWCRTFIWTFETFDMNAQRTHTTLKVKLKLEENKNKICFFLSGPKVNNRSNNNYLQQKESYLGFIRLQ